MIFVMRTNHVVAKMRCPLHPCGASQNKTHDGIRNGVFLYKKLNAVKNYKWGMIAPFFKLFHQGNT